MQDITEETIPVLWNAPQREHRSMCTEQSLIIIQVCWHCRHTVLPAKRRSKINFKLQKKNYVNNYKFKTFKYVQTPYLPLLWTELRGSYHKQNVEIRGWSTARVFHNFTAHAQIKWLAKFCACGSSARLSSRRLWVVVQKLVYNPHRH